MSPIIRASALPLRAVRAGIQPRHLTTSVYDSTLNSLKIDHNTRIIYQGFTGKAATVNALQNIQWGTNIVGGVTPGKSGQHLDMPLYSSVEEAAKALKPTATSVFVAAPFAASAIEEAIAAEIPLIVAVAEHVPLHDMLRVHSILRTQKASRLVGANCPGITNPRSNTRIGFMPHPSFLPGVIGIVGKSGTLSYDAVASTTRVGLGQSLVIGMGGDAVEGTNLVDAVKVFLEDNETEGIVVIGEIGGDTEMQVADVVSQYRAEGGKKPVMALVSGSCAVHGKTMGHAGAFRGIGDPSVDDKIKALVRAGVVMVQHPGEFGQGMLKLLGRQPPRESVKGMGPNGPAQKRGLHIMARRRPALANPPALGQQKKTLYTEDPSVAHRLLTEFEPAIHVSLAPPTEPTFGFGFAVDRATRTPKVQIIPAGSGEVISIPFDYHPEPSLAASGKAFYKLNLALTPENSNIYEGNLDFNKFHLLFRNAWGFFRKLDAYSIFFRRVSARGGVHLDSKDSVVFHLDHTFHPPTELVGLEVEAAKHGIVYLMFPGEGSIGTLVNGAGLAMNTCDTITARGGSPANFLDTGGKATGRTVVESLRTVLSDTRVKAVFVNIFGGLTDCQMIAEGILMAYKELDMANRGIPLVVRLRGTNDEIGQKIIKDSGLPVLAFDELDDAVAKVIELAK